MLNSSDYAKNYASTIGKSLDARKKPPWKKTIRERYLSGDRPRVESIRPTEKPG